MEKIAKAVDHLFFHHHSLGWDRYPIVNKIKGLAVQEIIQDPNGPRLPDVIDKDFITACLEIPLKFDVNLMPYDNYKEILEKLKPGRFLVVLKPDSPEQGNKLFKELKGA